MKSHKLKKQNKKQDSIGNRNAYTEINTENKKKKQNDDSKVKKGNKTENKTDFHFEVKMWKDVVVGIIG